MSTGGRFGKYGEQKRRERMKVKQTAFQKEHTQKKKPSRQAKKKET